MTTNKRTTIQSIEEIEADFDLMFPDDDVTGYRKAEHNQYGIGYKADLCCGGDYCFENCGEDKKRIIKSFYRTKINELLDEAIGEEKEETCDCGGSKYKHEVIGCNGDLHLTEYEEGYNDKRKELLSLKQKINERP